MPFTLAHPAAALPFQRTRLVMPALVIGCMAPDLEYFIPFRQHGRFGHTLAGVFAFDLPLSIAVLWLFYRFVREPLASCLPESARARLDLNRNSQYLKPFSRFLMTVLSILVGVATHLVWDAFTHSEDLLTTGLTFLNETVSIPWFGPRPWYGILQYVSSAIGIFVILLWCFHWYRNTRPIHHSQNRLLIVDRTALACMFSVAAVSAFFRASASGIPHGVGGTQRFMTDMAITGMTVLWIEILIYSVVRDISRKVKPG